MIRRFRNMKIRTQSAIVILCAIIAAFAFFELLWLNKWKFCEAAEDLDLFYANDFIITSHLVSAEIAGYLPYGEGWKYICDGRTAWDGDRPINTNGGRTSFGHAHAASGLADVYEACKQMWGECGQRQVKKMPKTAMLRGYGGAQNVAAVVIRTLE